MLSLFLLVLQYQRRISVQRVSGPIEDVVVVVEGVLVKIVRTYTSTIDKYARGLTHYDHVVELEKEVEDLKHQVQSKGSLRHDLDIMKELVLTIDRVGRYQAMGASVTAAFGAPEPTILRVDRGFEDGVRVGQGVVSGFGVCGRVSKVSKHSASVTLLSDSRSAIDVITQDARVRGILEPGDLRGTLSVRNFDRLADVRVDDQLITSGLGRGFPVGIPAGRISALLDAKNDDLYQEVIVEPMGDIGGLERVVILRDGSFKGIPLLGRAESEAWQSMVPSSSKSRTNAWVDFE